MAFHSNTSRIFVADSVSERIMAISLEDTDSETLIADFAPARGIVLDKDIFPPVLYWSESVIPRSSALSLTIPLQTYPTLSFRPAISHCLPTSACLLLPDANQARAT